MTVLTLEEIRAVAPEQELAAKLREDAFMIRGPYTKSPKPDRKSFHTKKDHFLALASRLLRMCFRAS